MVTNGITYGASQLTSESVSYIKNGETITVKKALDDLINTSLTEIDKLKEKVSDYEEQVHFLSDVAKVGDYVAYDAGTWNESKSKPKAQGEFGGYTSDTNRGESVVCRESQAPSLQGWRVLEIDQNTKTVTLVHAGQPECYYHSGNSSTDQKASIDNLNSRGNQYVNKAYATSGRSMTKEDTDKINSSSDLRKINTTYWLANAWESTYLWSIYSNGNINSGYSGAYVFGFRPVVVLKSKILTTGKGKDQVGNNDAWLLVDPSN